MRTVSCSGADVPPGDKREPPAEFLCHIKASSPLLNCDTQPFISTGAWWLVGGGGATDGLWFVGFPALSWGFPLLPHIIEGGIWYHSSILETLAADENGAYYFCESLPHVRDADALYCLSFPVGTAEFELTCVFSWSGLIWEQKGRWERRNKNQLLSNAMFYQRGVHLSRGGSQTRAESVSVLLLWAVMLEGEENSFCSVHFSDRPSFVCRCNLMSFGCS